MQGSSLMQLRLLDGMSCTLLACIPSHSTLLSEILGLQNSTLLGALELSPPVAPLADQLWFS